MNCNISLKYFRVVWVFVIFACLNNNGANAWYNNNYQQELKVNCPVTMNLYRIKSIFSNSVRDRRFDIRCRSTAGIVNAACTPWSPLTSVVSPFTYNCKKDYYLNGIRGVWVPGSKDRRWSFRCCRRFTMTYKNHQCRSTRYVNGYRQAFDYIAPEDYVITAVRTSSRHWLHRDRRWGFTICQQKRVLGRKRLASTMDRRWGFTICRQKRDPQLAGNTVSSG